MEFFNPKNKPLKFRCKICRKTFTVLQDGVTFYKRFGGKIIGKWWNRDAVVVQGIGDYQEEARSNTVAMLQLILNAFFDLGDLPFSGIIIIDEKWLPMGNGIFHFGYTALDGITGRTFLQMCIPFTEKEAEEFLILLSKLVDVEFLVSDGSVIKP